MQVDAPVFQGSPEPFYKNVVEEAAFSVHRDPHANPAQPVRPGEGREQRSLIGIHDLGRAEIVDGLVQRLDKELGLQRVRDAPGQNLAGVPIQDRQKVEEPAPHGQIADFRTSDLVRAIHSLPFRQVGMGLVPFRWPARVGLLVDRHQSHQAHKPTYPFLVHQVPVIAQVPGLLPDAEERLLQELLVDSAILTAPRLRSLKLQAQSLRPKQRQVPACPLPAQGQHRQSPSDMPGL